MGSPARHMDPQSREDAARHRIFDETIGGQADIMDALTDATTPEDLSNDEAQPALADVT